MKRKSEPLTDEQRALAAQFMPLLLGFARKKARTPTEFDDLVSHLHEPLLRAARGFKREKGYTFQAFLTRILHNAYVDLMRRRKIEVPLQDWHVERALPVKTSRPQVQKEEPDPPLQQPSAVERALYVLREGGTLQAARKAAARELGRMPARSTVQRWAKAAALCPRPRGRPRKLDPQQLVRWLLDPRALPGIWVKRGRRKGARASQRALAEAAEIGSSTVKRGVKKARALLRR